MQGRLGDMTLRDAGRSLGRYQPFLITILAIILVATFMPGDTPQEETVEGPVAGQTQTGTGTATEGATDTGGGAAAGGSGAVGGETGGGDAAGSTEPEAQGAAPADGGAGLTGPQTAEPTADALDHPDCDPETGRMKIPSNFAAPCVPPIDDNPGNTYQGVTSEEITVVRMIGEGDAASEAFLAAAGVDDSEEEQRQQYEEWVEFFETYYEQYGRSINLIHYEVSGEGDEAARADAIHVAEEIGAFASFGSGGHGNPFVNEVTHRGVLCMCTTSQPIENYHEWAPYVWSTLMASTEAYVHRAEYIGKRLWGDPPEHSPDPDFALTEERKIALVYFETEDEAYKAGADFFEEELATYGAHLTDRIAYLFDLARAQEQARTIIARLQDKGVTSVAFAGDPIYPAFFTNEATNQQYFPEWIVTGSALTDTPLFGRTYDQQQWENAFGVSMQPVQVPQELWEPHRLFTWHFNKEPTAQGTYRVIYTTVWPLMTGIHLAGPDLNPETFRDGMFSYPLSGQGMVTAPQSSFGTTVWPWETYLQNDDMTEIWWDPTQDGEDQVGNYGLGMYQYVNGGHRYLPGEWPSTEPRVFDEEGAVHTYNELPESDQHPEYEPKRED